MGRGIIHTSSILAVFYFFDLDSGFMSFVLCSDVELYIYTLCISLYMCYIQSGAKQKSIDKKGQAQKAMIR